MVEEVDFDTLVGSNIQRYRTAVGLSQAELAAALSADGEHVHQQTIQKIEKGTRPLKYSEAIRVCRALRIDPTSLTEDDEEASIKADYLERFFRLGQLQSELHDFADRLVPILVEVAAFLSLGRHQVGEFPEAGELVEEAEHWVTGDWGEALNLAIWARLREHPQLMELPAEYKALPTYGEILKRVSERPWTPTGDETRRTDELANDAPET